MFGKSEKNKKKWIYQNNYRALQKGSFKAVCHLAFDSGSIKTNILACKQDISSVLLILSKYRVNEK